MEMSPATLMLLLNATQWSPYISKTGNTFYYPTYTALGVQFADAKSTLRLTFSLNK
uniref:Uncharacterized protein n=1 Tax=Arundo donax TaxID=35708 RepID=A0A0A8XU81_ARUDO